MLLKFKVFNGLNLLFVESQLLSDIVGNVEKLTSFLIIALSQKFAVSVFNNLK